MLLSLPPGLRGIQGVLMPCSLEGGLSKSIFQNEAEAPLPGRLGILSSFPALAILGGASGGKGAVGAEN